jgi:hypothetical protein
MQRLSAVPCTARDGDVILEIVGMGPGTAVAAETR